MDAYSTLGCYSVQFRLCEPTFRSDNESDVIMLRHPFATDEIGQSLVCSAICHQQDRLFRTLQEIVPLYRLIDGWNPSPAALFGGLTGDPA